MSYVSIQAWRSSDFRIPGVVTSTILLCLGHMEKFILGIFISVAHDICIPFLLDRERALLQLRALPRR
jgi:hypothetical protein